MEPKALEQRFGAGVAEPFMARYNAAPSQTLPVILSSDPGRIEMLRWGLAPSWFLQAKHRDGIINVRAETARPSAADAVTAAREQMAARLDQLAL